LRWDIPDGNVCIAQAENGTIRKFFVRGLRIAEGTGDVIAELQDAGYRMQDGAVTTEAVGNLQFTNYNLQFGEGTVAASADCGKVEAASCRLDDGESTRSQDGSSTLAVHFYIANHRGDTVLVIGESGAAESHLQYDAFGNVTARSGSFTPSYTFSTKEHVPGANLYAYAYRVYDPHAGRWTQRDPIDYQDSVNLYQFCGNNGVNWIDARGLEDAVVVAGKRYIHWWDRNINSRIARIRGYHARNALLAKGWTVAYREGKDVTADELLKLISAPECRALIFIGHGSPEAMKLSQNAEFYYSTLPADKFDLLALQCCFSLANDSVFRALTFDGVLVGSRFVTFVTNPFNNWTTMYAISRVPTIGVPLNLTQAMAYYQSTGNNAPPSRVVQ